MELFYQSHCILLIFIFLQLFSLKVRSLGLQSFRTKARSLIEQVFIEHDPFFATLVKATYQKQLIKSSVKTEVPSSHSKSVDIVYNPNLEVSLPWSQSVSDVSKLSYMPMLEYQLDLIKKLNMETVSIEEKFVYRKSSVKPARIGNLCFKSKEFRCVRLTYFDAGDAVQVFNSLWYPSYEYDLPLLGIDLISLGKGRLLNVIDFQPLHPTEEYSEKYINHLSSIRDKYPDLQGQLSGKFYDDTSFFSKNMLFGRFTDDSKVNNVVLPAYREYLLEYIKLMENAIPNSNEENIKEVYIRQKAYDVYSALKDPAVGLFDAYFGKEWSKSFVHDYLFKLSTDEDISSHSNVHSFKVSTSGEVTTSNTSPHS